MNYTTTQSKNPKIIAMQRRVLALLQDFEHENPFIAGVLRDFAWDRNVSHRIGYLGAEALVNVIRKAGLAQAMSSATEIDTHPDWFWDLADTAAAIKDRKTRARSLVAVAGFYYHLRRLRLIGEYFSKDLRSPYQFLGMEDFRQLLVKDYTHRDAVTVVTYAHDRHPHIMVIPCRNPVIREMIIDAFRRWPNVWDRRCSALRWPMEAEGWFEGTTDDVRTYLDLNATMLVTAKEHIMRTYTDIKDRRNAMRFLFHVFTIQIEDHPKHRFFTDSRLWTNTLVCDKRVPIHLANGYDIALYGQTDVFRGKTGGILLIHKNADMESSTSMNTEVYTVNLTDVKPGPLLDALTDFILHNNVCRKHIPHKFIVWLQERKRNCSTCTHLSKADMDAYRVEISRRDQEGHARNQTVNELNKFIDYCVAKHFLTIDADARELFVYFQSTYEPKPRPLTEKDIIKLHETLKKLAMERDPRFELVDIMLSILYLSDIRSGELCKTRLDRMIRLPDGSTALTSRRKNRGTDQKTHIVSRYISPLLDKALEATADVREACPVELDQQLFIYANPASASKRFNVYTTNKLNNDLALAGELAGIGRLASGRIRDTYMSSVIKFAAGNGLTDLERNCLTGHAVPHTVKAYSIPDIKDILEFTEPTDI